MNEPEHYSSLLVGAEEWAIDQVRTEIERLQIYEQAYADAVSACLWMHGDKSLGLALASTITTDGVLALKEQRDSLVAENAKLLEALEQIRDTPAFTTSPVAQVLSVYQIARAAIANARKPV